MSEQTNLLDLSGRTALVTGAGQGIGATTAHYLAEHGAQVVVNDFDEARADAVAGEIREHGGKAVGIQADVTDFESVTSMIAEAKDVLGVVDVLINNAGNAGANPSRPSREPFWEKDPAEWEAFLQVNLYGVLNCCRAALPGMIEAGKGGRLLTVISEAGRQGESGLEAYSAAKAGAAGLMRGLARTVARYDITSNCVAIGATRTPAVQGMMENEEFAKRVLKSYLIRRFGEPSDVAAMLTFLSSESASWITAQTYPVNGGFSVSQ